MDRIDKPRVPVLPRCRVLPAASGSTIRGLLTDARCGYRNRRDRCRAVKLVREIEIGPMQRLISVFEQIWVSLAVGFVASLFFLGGECDRSNLGRGAQETRVGYRLRRWANDSGQAYKYAHLRTAMAAARSVARQPDRYKHPVRVARADGAVADERIDLGVFWSADAVLTHLQS